MPVSKQEWRGQLVLGGVDDSKEPWYELELSQDNELANGTINRDDWAWAAAEAFVVGMAEEWEVDDGEVITVLLIAPDTRRYEIAVGCQKTWNCTPMHVKKL